MSEPEESSFDELRQVRMYVAAEAHSIALADQRRTSAHVGGILSKKSADSRARKSVPTDFSQRHVRLAPELEMPVRENQLSLGPAPMESSGPLSLMRNSIEHDRSPSPFARTSEARQRRTSLHGKTINIRTTRTDARYRRLQAKIYNFLERPKTCKSIFYHVLV
ncbi:hypothetical protein Ciccas_007775 [Cichlidogyrus casuarinus]|uniref:Uncharacterized protein n=1 Tax=Cichlidogyrus casuarinus TaxID=1844966 RepID=A0ABD2Q2K7_9PLAT